MITLQQIKKVRWVWAAVAIVLLWVVLSIGTGQFRLSNLSGVVASAAFLTTVAIGQMFVITSGGGNIDLSIGSTITLSAYVATGLLNGSDAALVWVIPLIIAMGLGIGAVNAFLVVKIRIPAIIATLAVGYLLVTATLLTNRSFNTYAVSPFMSALTTAKVAGIPVISLAALALTVLAAFLLGKTIFGRRLLAVGQNAEAAAVAGISVGWVTAQTFLISGALASINGALVAAYAGGAFLDMGTPYLLQSVGSVVIGGTLIFGGSSTALGTYLGAILLTMIVTTMQILGLKNGTQEMVQGVMIIAVLALAGSGLANQKH